MKTKHWFHATTLICGLAVFTLSSCTDNEDNPVVEPEQLAEATIMWYGHGGGNVDAAILEDFRQFYKAKSFDNVNVVAQYKASYAPTIYQGQSMDVIMKAAEELAEGKTDEELEQLPSAPYFFLCHPNPGSTYRFAIDGKKTLRQQLVETEPYGEDNCDVTCPDSLTSFINWAAANYPAKKYILVMADHGGGYMPNADLADAAKTRGLVFDDGHDSKCFSAKSFARGVRNANVRPEGIVLYLCLMNNMEFLYDAKDVTDYITASTYVMWGGGGALYSIVDNLAAGNDTRTTLSNFVDANVNRWDELFYHPDDPDPNAPLYYDLTMTETKKLNDLAPVLKEFTDRLVDTYQNGTPEQRALIDQCTANAVKVQNDYPFYDFAKYMESAFDLLPEVFDLDLYNRIASTFNGCIVNQRYSKYLTQHNYMVDYSVLLGVKGSIVRYVYDESSGEPKLTGAIVYRPDGTTEIYRYNADTNNSDGSLNLYELLRTETWPSTFEATYQQTTFDRLVGWSRFLLLNEAAPPAWSPSSFNFKLPEDNMEGVTNL